MLLMTEKHKRDGICHAIHRYAKANNNYIKYYDKNKDHHILSIGTYVIYMDGQCLKNCL